MSETMIKIDGETSGAKAKGLLKPGRQWIGINNIILDEKFQPRAKTDFEWVHDLSGFRKDGSEFPPVKVYQLPDGRLVAASGFHRIPAMKMAGEDQILCDVVDGTEEDAIVFAAGSNKGNGVKPMGPKDITKAVEMLLATAWWSRSNMSIADHVGCSSTKVKAIRTRLSAQTGKPLPENVEDKQGRSVAYKKATSPGTPRKITRTRGRKGRPGVHGGSYHYQATYRGKGITATTYEAVEKKLNKLIEADKSKMTMPAMKTALVNTMGFDHVYGQSEGMARRSFPGLFSYYLKNTLCTPCDFANPDAITSAVGRLIAARRYRGNLSARMVVLCYPEDGPAKVLDLYRAEGFEFLTPEELAESLKTES